MPPKAASGWPVVSLVPTPHMSIFAPHRFMSAIACSSRSPEQTIFAFVKPALSSIRRDQAFEIQNVEQSRFQKLTLDNRTAHSNQRLVRENQCSFGNCIDLTSQPQTAQVVEKTDTE